MQLRLPFGLSRCCRPVAEQRLAVGETTLRLMFAPDRRARRYILRLKSDGQARVTIPRGGTAEEARRFAERSIPWLKRQVAWRAAAPVIPKAWKPGTEILFRGQPVRLTFEPGPNGHSVRFDTEALTISAPADDLRRSVEAHLRRLASKELPARVAELAARHQIAVQRVTVRNQRSRWGSCSRRGTISLNWRLVQTPLFVRDYIILHEMAHLRQMNHSPCFWREVSRLCPGYRVAELWLKKHPHLVG